MTGKSIGYSCALGAVFLWAGNFVLARAVAEHIGPVQLNFWRWLVAFLCVLPFAVSTWRQNWPEIKNHLFFICAQGIIGVALLNAFFYHAASTTSSINIVLFVPSAPITVMLLSRIFCGEPITYSRLLGLGIILSGLILLISRGSWSNLTAFDIHTGDLWSIAGVICFGVYTFLTRYRPQNISMSTLHTAIFGAGLLASLPALFLEMHFLPPTVWTAEVLGSIVYTGIGCSCMAYILWTKAIDNIGPVTAGMIYYSIPLFTALKGVLILGESVTLIHVVGGTLMLSGIVVASLPSKIPSATIDHTPCVDTK